MENDSRWVVNAELHAGNSVKKLGFKTNSNLLYGINEEENIGLKFNERKRFRDDPSAIGPSDIIISPSFIGPHLNEHISEVGISTGDLPDSSTSGSAELALQASQFQ